MRTINKLFQYYTKNQINEIVLVDGFEMIGSACSPVPFEDRLPSCSGIGSHIFSLIHKFVMGVIVVVQDVEVSTIQEVAVLGVAEIDDPAFLEASVGVKHHDAFIAVGLFHSTDSVEGDEAVGERFGFVVPFFAGIGVIAEVCGKTISILWSSFRMAGDVVIADVCSGGSSDFLLDFKAGGRD